jgi:hypothetical protein
MKSPEFLSVESAMEELASPELQKSKWLDRNDGVDIFYPIGILYESDNIREWPEEYRAECFTPTEIAAVLATMDEFDRVDARHEHIQDRYQYQESMLSDPDWPRVVAAAKKFYQTADQPG